MAQKKLGLFIGAFQGEEIPRTIKTANFTTVRNGGRIPTMAFDGVRIGRGRLEKHTRNENVLVDGIPIDGTLNGEFIVGRPKI